MVIKGFAHMRYNTPEKIEALYEQYYLVIPPCLDSGRGNNDGDDFSFGLNSFIVFYVDMHKLTGNSKWLDLAKDTCEHILDNTDQRRVEKGELTLTPLEDPIDVAHNYYQAPFPYQSDGLPVPGWSSYDGSTGGLRCQILQDGQIIAALCHFAEYVIDGSISEYTTIASECLDKSRGVLDSHINSFQYGKVKYDMVIAGSYYYPDRTGSNSVYSHPLAYNHGGGATKAALICNKYLPNQDYVDRCEAFMQYVRDSRTYISEGDRYFWAYKQSSATNAEDINHGSYSLGALFKAHQLGMLGVTKAEMTSYTNSILHAKSNFKVGTCAEKIDKTGTIPAGETFNVGQMSYLSEFNYDICGMGRDLASVNYIAKYASHFGAISALLLNLKEEDK